MTKCRKERSIQPLLFGGYESGPSFPRSWGIRLFGDAMFGRSSYRRRKEFGEFLPKFRQKKVEPCDSGAKRRGFSVEPWATVCRATGQSPGRPLEAGRRAQGARRSTTERINEASKTEVGNLPRPVKQISLFHNLKLT